MTPGLTFKAMVNNSVYIKIKIIFNFNNNVLKYITYSALKILFLSQNIGTKFFFYLINLFILLYNIVLVLPYIDLNPP